MQKFSWRRLINRFKHVLPPLTAWKKIQVVMVSHMCESGHQKTHFENTIFKGAKVFISKLRESETLQFCYLWEGLSKYNYH